MAVIQTGKKSQLVTVPTVAALQWLNPTVNPTRIEMLLFQWGPLFPGLDPQALK